MDFGTNKTPVKIIKEGAFGKTYLETFILVLIVSSIKSVQMSWYWFNKQELLKKAKTKYDNNSGKEKLLNIIEIIEMF